MYNALTDRQTDRQTCLRLRSHSDGRFFGAPREPNHAKRQKSAAFRLTGAAASAFCIAGAGRI